MNARNLRKLVGTTSREDLEVFLESQNRWHENFVRTHPEVFLAW